MGRVGFRGPWFVLAAVVIVMGLALFSLRRESPVPVGAIATPIFPRIDLPSLGTTLDWFGGFLRTRSGDLWLRDLLPNQGGALWLSLALTLAVALGRGITVTRIADLLVLQVVGWVLFGSLDFLANRPGPEAMRWMRSAFTLASVATAVLWVRTFLLQSGPFARRWQPALPASTLRAIALTLTLMNLGVVFLNPPDDSSFFANLGAQRMRETGRLPYGDPLLTNTAGAAYGPVMYGLHAVVQGAMAVPLPPRAGTDVPRDIGGDPRPPDVVPRLILAVSHLTTLGLLFVLARRLMGDAAAWGVLVLYGSAPWLISMASTRASVAGLTYVSHIVPPTVTLAAFAVLTRPLVSGLLLGIAAGVGFYPAFFFPVWAGAQWGRGRHAALWFCAGFGLACGVILAWVVMASQPADGLSLVGTIVRDTLGHHSDPNGYGLSVFGLWGQQTGLMAGMARPLAGTSTLTAPFFLLYAGTLLAAGRLARSADLPRLALLTAGAAIGANLWKIHATVSYVAWYAPFLLLGLLALGASTEPEDPSPH